MFEIPSVKTIALTKHVKTV